LVALLNCTTFLSIFGIRAVFSKRLRGSFSRRKATESLGFDLRNSKNAVATAQTTVA
jgi:hypothetical protein